MADFKKFEFEDLPKSAVVNKNNQDIENGIEDFINKAVTDHLKRIVPKPQPYEIKDFNEAHSKENEDSVANISDDGSVGNDSTIAPEGIVNATEQLKPDSSLEGNASDVSESKEGDLSGNSGGEVQSDNLSVDIEEIKRLEFERGFKEAEDKYNQQQSNEQKDFDVAEKLLEKLSQLKPEEEFDTKVAKLSASSIALIAKKLHMILPVNFEEILHQGIIEKLSKFYQEGIISVTVHPDRYDFCSKILQSDSIPAKFKGNFKVAADDKLSDNDCKLEWKDTHLEYSTEQLAEEIDKIIERLTNAA